MESKKSLDFVLSNRASSKSPLATSATGHHRRRAHFCVGLLQLGPFEVQAMSDDEITKSSASSGAEPNSKPTSPPWVQIVLALISLSGIIVVGILNYEKPNPKPSQQPIQYTTISPQFNNDNRPIINNEINNYLPNYQVPNKENNNDNIATNCFDMYKNWSGIKPNKEQLADALILNSWWNRISCVQMIVNAGVDINAYNFINSDKIYRGPALYTAIESNNWDTALYLLAKGADPNLPYRSSSGTRFYALELARFNRAPDDVINAIKSHGGK